MILSKSSDLPIAVLLVAVESDCDWYCCFLLCVRFFSDLCIVWFCESVFVCVVLYENLSGFVSFDFGFVVV